MFPFLAVTNFQEELQLEATNQDHRLLRSLTRDIITSDLELIDFGLQLDLPPSMVKQKLRDYPRSIEMASYMVASEWWDSCSNSREERYGVLLDTVRSMGKNNTAAMIEGMLEESVLCREGVAHMDRRPGYHGNHQQLQGNSNRSVCPPVTRNVGAIENSTTDTQIVPHHSFNRNGVEIVDISGEDENSVTTNGRQDNSQPHVQHYDSYGASVGGFSNRQESVNVANIESFKPDSKTDICSASEGAISDSKTDSILFNILEHVCDEGTPSKRATQNLRVRISEEQTSKIRDHWGDNDELVGAVGGFHGEDPAAKSFQNSAAMAPDVDFRNIPIKDRNSLSIDQVHQTNFTGETVVDLNDQRSRVTNQTGVVNGQTSVGNGQTSVVNDQTGVANGQTGVVNGQTGVVNDQTSVVNDQTGVVNDQTGVVKGQTGIVNDQTGVVNGQTGIVNGQTGVVNGKTGVVNGQTGAMNGKTGVVNGQRGVVNGQRCLANGQTEEDNDQTVKRNKNHSSSLLGNITRLFGRKNKKHKKNGRFLFPSIRSDTHGGN